MIDRNDNPEYLNDFLAYNATILNKSPNTVKEYNYDLAHFLKFIRYHFGEVSVDPHELIKIKEIEIKDFPLSKVAKIELQDIHAFLQYLNMNIEFELRILDVVESEMIEKLESLGAEKVGEFDQKRYVYDFNPKREKEWIRLRTNGSKTTLCYKNVEKNTLDGTKELEIEVSSLEKTNEMLNILGYNAKAYQENRRVRYVLDGIEIDIDSWPLIPTYMEIEGKNEEEVLKMVEKLGISKEKICYLNCEDIYKEIYGINIDEIKELKF